MDALLNLVGEFVMDRTRIAQLGIQFEQRYAENEMIEALNETAAHIGRITDELQEQIMNAASKETVNSAENKQDKPLEMSAPAHYLVVVGVGMQQVGLMVDSLIGEQEVVIKSLGGYLGEVRGISGATILGNDNVALIVAINSLVTIAIEERELRYAA